MKIIDKACHRNGVAAHGFYVGIVEDPFETSHDCVDKFLLIAFENDPMSTALLQLDRLACGDIKFGTNSWRGDRAERARATLIEEVDSDDF
jgi:hypothetical protein